MWNLCATGTQILRAADCNPFVGKPSGFFDSLKPPARVSVRAAVLSVQLLCVKDVVADRGRVGQAAVEPRGVAGREVFSSPHMSPKKMIGFLCACGRKLYEVL